MYQTGRRSTSNGSMNNAMQLNNTNDINQRRSNSYQGFNKYTDELNRYLNQESNNVAGIASTGESRSKSMTQGAGQAAMVAIQRHNQQQNTPRQTPRQTAGLSQPARRANSMTATSNRSNSMRSYTYHPKPSYTVGQPLGNANQGVRRFNSLNSKSSVGSFQRNNHRVSSLSSQNSYVRSRSQPVVYEQDNDGGEDGNVTITTKTTKVVDSQGNVLSITVETIKTYADGSTVVDTTTKNISRSNSRASSLNSQSMALKGNAGRHGSMLSNGGGGAYNLSKIDEDLQDFDYNYELDNDVLTQQGRGHAHEDAHGKYVNHDKNLNHGLRLNRGNYDSPYQGDEFGSPELNSYAGGNESMNSNGHLKSLTSFDSSRPLKSILKKKTNVNDKEEDDDGGFADAVEELRSDKSKPETNDSQHPYKSLGSPQVNQTPEFKVPPSPTLHAPQQVNRIVTNTGNKRTRSLLSSPVSRHDDVFSDKSETSNSIKFVDKHETIPIYYNNDNIRAKETEHSKPSDKDFYTIAMQVAMERVYGNKENQQSPKLNAQRSTSMNSNVSPISDHKPKKEKKVRELNEQGVSDNYTYQNHHKEFVGLSLRDGVDPKQTSRKERAKEEKKQQKSEIKEQKQKQKEKEKMAAESAKDEKKSQKNQKHGRFASLFGRRKSLSNDDDSTLTTEDNKEVNDDNSQNLPANINGESASDINNGHTSAQVYPRHEKVESNMGEHPKTNDPSEMKPLKEGVIGIDNSNPETERRLIGGNSFNPEKERRLMNTAGFNSESEPGNYSHGTELNSYDPDIVNSGTSNINNSGVSSLLQRMKQNYDSVRKMPSKPMLNDSSSGSYSMRFPRTNDAKPDSNTLVDSSNKQNTVVSDSKTQDSEDSNTEREVLQNVPGTMEGVDSSILRATVNDDSEGTRLFDQDVAQEKSSTLDPSTGALNDGTSIYSNDAEEKRKEKVLDPITVPVLNEIKSETTSIETQSNKYTDIDTGLETGDMEDSDALLESGDTQIITESSHDVHDPDTATRTGDLSPNLQGYTNNQITHNSYPESKTTNFKNVDEAVVVNEEDIRGYNNSFSDDPIKVQKQKTQKPISKIENEINSYPAVANTNDKITGDTDAYSRGLSQKPVYDDFTHTHDSSLKSKTAFSDNSKVDYLGNSLPPSSYDNHGDNINENSASNIKTMENQSSVTPIENELVDSKGIDKNNFNVMDATTDHQELTANSLRKSSFEHMQREECDSPVVVHNSEQGDSKPPKKGSKFKQKLFKYFVNSYTN